MHAPSTLGMQVIIAVIYVLFIAPGALLVVAWRRASISSRITALLVLVSFASWLLLISGVFWDGFIGFAHSSRRATTINANFVVAALAGLAAGFVANRSRWWLTAASAVLAVDWLYTAVVSSVI